MARNLHVYPKGSITTDEWTLTMKVYEHATRITSRFTETVAAGVTAERFLPLLKASWDLIVADGDTDQDVADSLFVDDIQPGPRTATVWGNWQARAEGIIAGLTTGYTVADFWAGWTMGDTQAVRSDANRAMVSGPGGIGRGWVIVTKAIDGIGSVHQHEGDGTNTDE